MSDAKSQVVIGIDTGRTGGIAVLENGRIIRVIEIDDSQPLKQMVAVLWEYTRTSDDVEIIYEKPNGFMSKKASWWAGYFEATCHALHEWAGSFIPGGNYKLRAVRPQEWQKFVFTTTAKKMDTKKRALRECRRLLPYVNTTHDGCIDACLIAFYGFQTSRKI